MEACLSTARPSTLLSLSKRNSPHRRLALRRRHHHHVTCCTGDSDWRLFRARLVAGENLSAVGEKWAHAIHEPEKGCLLIASEKLDGVHIFERAVVLVLSTGPVGASGIILNRPSLMSIKEAKSTALDFAGTFSERPLFFGGPLQEGLFLVGPKGADGCDGVGRSGVFEEVMSGLYYGSKESLGSASEMVKRSVIGLSDLRFFDGFCRWEKDQLRREIGAGYWTVAACSPPVIGLGTDVTAGFWEEILGLVGPRKVW